MAATGLPPNFAKVVALMDSSLEGERIAAFEMAAKMLAAAGLKWRDVVSLNGHAETASSKGDYYAAARAWSAYKTHEAEQSADDLRSSLQAELRRRQAEAGILRNLQNHRRGAPFILMNFDAELTPWERDFLADIAHQKIISEGQRDKYLEIANRVLQARAA